LNAHQRFGLPDDFRLLARRVAVDVAEAVKRYELRLCIVDVVQSLAVLSCFRFVVRCS
jgi:hypothetical protein